MTDRVKSLAFFCAICGSVALMLWFNKDSNPVRTANDRRLEEAYPGLLHVSERLGCLELDEEHGWDRETIYQIWRDARAAVASADGFAPPETRPTLTSPSNADVTPERKK